MRKINPTFIQKIAAMKNLICLVTCVILFSITHANAQKKPVHKATASPFQGTKEFCSFSKPVKYKVTITGKKVTIIYLYKEYKNIVKGEFRNGKLFTNDKNETKLNAGRVYLLTSTYISINNLEGGDYVEYDLCNQKMPSLSMRL